MKAAEINSQINKTFEEDLKSPKISDNEKVQVKIKKTTPNQS